MKQTEPKVFLIGETRLIEDNENGLGAFLEHVGAPEWTTDAKSDSEAICEFMGRLCYKSFKPGLNPNVTKVREGNDTYLAHVLDVNHGSILEHCNLNFVFADISRVFSHELVRHRVGVGISQESLRYVRLTDLSSYIPTCIKESEEGTEIFVKTVEQLENLQKQLAEVYDIDNMKDFGKKKELTSAFRRIAPIGLATNIGWSCNFRILRHVLEMRTNPAAEEEMRLVFGKVFDIVNKRYPNIFQDYEVEMVNDLPWVKKRGN